MLDRDEDMLITGGRHPFLAKYKVLDVGSCAGDGRDSAISLEKLGMKIEGFWDVLLTFFMTTCRSSKKK